MLLLQQPRRWSCFGIGGFTMTSQLLEGGESQRLFYSRCVFMFACVPHGAGPVSEGLLLPWYCAIVTTLPCGHVVTVVRLPDYSDCSLALVTLSHMKGKIPHSRPTSDTLPAAVETACCSVRLQRSRERRQRVGVGVLPGSVGRRLATDQMIGDRLA